MADRHGGAPKSLQAKDPTAAGAAALVAPTAEAGGTWAEADPAATAEVATARLAPAMVAHKPRQAQR